MLAVLSLLRHGLGFATRRTKARTMMTGSPTEAMATATDQPPPAKMLAFAAQAGMKSGLRQRCYSTELLGARPWDRVV